MARQRSVASTTDRGGRRVRGEVREALEGASAEQLRRLGRVLGNDALSGKVAGNDRLRDALLAFVAERLQAIELAQRAEKKALQTRGDWFRRTMRGERGITLPEPSRWAGPAHLYRKAGEALCAGDLGRGADLLRQATEADRATFKAAPKQLDLRPKERAAAVDPAAMQEARAGEGCNPTTAPELFAAATRIEAVTQDARAVGIWPTRGQHHWWEAEVEEEEDPARTGDRKLGKRLREPAAQADLARRPDAPVQAPAPAVEQVAAQLTPRAPEREAAAPKAERGKRPKR